MRQEEDSDLGMETQQYQHPDIPRRSWYLRIVSRGHLTLTFERQNIGGDLTGQFKILVSGVREIV